MAQLGRLAGTTASTVNKLEKGEMNLTQRWMNRLAAALEVRQAELITEANATTHIDARLLGVALSVTEAVLEGEPEDVRNAVIGDLTAAAYDVLVEARNESKAIDDSFVQMLIATNRRKWLRSQS